MTRRLSDYSDTIRAGFFTPRRNARSLLFEIERTDQFTQYPGDLRLVAFADRAEQPPLVREQIGHRRVDRVAAGVGELHQDAAAVRRIRESLDPGAVFVVWCNKVQQSRGLCITDLGAGLPALSLSKGASRFAA